jgi:hypothetical protein
MKNKINAEVLQLLQQTKNAPEEKWRDSEADLLLVSANT